MVPSADEHLASALRRARRIMPSVKLKNEAAKARNKAARQMDGEWALCDMQAQHTLLQAVPVVAVLRPPVFILWHSCCWLTKTAECWRFSATKTMNPVWAVHK